ncbi:hypothetical protein MHY87_15610 [Microvirga sp. ACRRW]|uniref:hypothetical protein n=1 Tax=Microvirga sp. ACRRW TaxID=2918205 RepID=UPI001EF693AF|nr:hypothetical protein [Microvirga sp. ACRRW]MCG7394330.1 hypothetical protein [Microvirga sp. ACRRW]
MAHLKPNNYKELYSRDYNGSPSIDAMMREVLHMLGNIDFEHEMELDRLEKSATDQELKSYIKRKIRAAYEERREPYVELLATLRQRQHRLSFSQ